MTAGGQPSGGVVVVAPSGDPHADAVAAVLHARGVPTLDLDLRMVTSTTLDVRPGSHVRIGDAIVTNEWTVWWRRGSRPVPPAGLPAEEAELAAEETLAIVLGGLLSLRLRWVDDPFTVLRAEHTVRQLSIAQGLGVSTPATVATSDPRSATEFLAAGPAVAKTISSGPGLAPYVDEIAVHDVPLIARAATVLQRRVDAIADVRVTVVGGHVQAWQRPRRRTEPIDWRAADPHGHGFRPLPSPAPEGVAVEAVAINRALGLTVSVQDWLLAATGRYVFLEANPAGAWLFLPGADTVVVPALAEHLRLDRHDALEGNEADPPVVRVPAVGAFPP